MSGGFRVEKDSLGEVRVPEDALYGAQTQRAVENFQISGQRFGRRFIQALGLIKRAAAEANAELGLVAPDLAEAIATAAGEVAEGRWDDQFVLDVYQTGSGTSTNMNANEVIAHRAIRLLGDSGSPADTTVHPNDHVNFGQSSNDVIPTAIHVAARVAIEDELIPALEHLRDVLVEKAAEFDDVVKSGRTHLMDATPVRMGQEFAGYATQLAKGIDRVRRGSEEMAELALGGTATGTGINTHPEFSPKAIARLQDALGIAFHEAEDHFEAQGSRDAAVSASGALNTVAVSLMKIANDIRWLGSGPTSGIHELQLPAIQPGSSIMPGKVNPVMSEAMMMVAARVMGNHQTITVCGARGNFELNVMMPVLAQALLESIGLLAKVSRLFAERCIAGAVVNRGRCQELLERNPSIAAALNLHIGYDRASEVAKKAVAEGRSVREVVVELGLMKEDEVDEALNVRTMTEGGEEQGENGQGSETKEVPEPFPPHAHRKEGGGRQTPRGGERFSL